MDYRNLGTAGVKVSPLALGTMMLGAWGETSHDEAVRLIHRALDAGLNLIDTANVYAAGESERIVGKALAGRREEVVLATKVWGPMGDGPHQRGLSRKAIEQAVDASLERLGTEVIDLYQIHRPDPTVRWEEVLGTLTDLVRRGKVRYIGCSSNHYDGEGEWQRLLPAWEIVETLWVSERSGYERFVAFQPPYSMLRRVMEVRHFPMSRRHGLANIVWSPLEGGWLAGKYRRGEEPPADSPRAREWIGDHTAERFRSRLDAVERLLPLAEEAGVPLAQLALAWAAGHPDVTSVIIGPRTEAQLESCLAALEVDVSDDLRAAVDAIVPPGTSVL